MNIRYSTPSTPERALRQQIGGRHPVRDARVADLPLGAHEPLRHRLLVDEERAGDLRGGEAGERAQRQRDPGLDRQGRVAAGEHQPQPVVRHRPPPPRRVGLVLRLRQRASDRSRLVSAARRRIRSMARLRAAVVSHAAVLRGTPSTGQRGQRLGERLLGALLGEVPVAGDADQRRDHPSPLVPERLVDGGARVPRAAVRSLYSDQNGLTSISPARAIGCSAAISIASSRSLQSRTS